jgi:hypothetical protein
MTEPLEPRMRDILAASREVDGPDPEAAARSWVALQRRIARGEEPRLGRGPWFSGTRAAGARGFGIGLVVGLGLAAAVALWLPEGALLGLVRGDRGANAARYDAERRSEGGRAEPGSVTTSPAPERGEPRETSPAASVPAEPEAEPEMELAVDPPRTAGRSRGTADADLGAEVVLVRRAEEALAAGNPDGALAAARRHARRFPRGQLARERRLLEIEALCLKGHDLEARRLAEAFAGPGSSVLETQRLRRACTITKTTLPGHGTP